MQGKCCQKSFKRTSRDKENEGDEAVRRLTKIVKKITDRREKEDREKRKK